MSLSRVHGGRGGAARGRQPVAKDGLHRNTSKTRSPAKQAYPGGQPGTALELDQDKIGTRWTQTTGADGCPPVSRIRALRRKCNLNGGLDLRCS